MLEECRGCVRKNEKKKKTKKSAVSKKHIDRHVPVILSFFFFSFFSFSSSLSINSLLATSCRMITELMDRGHVQGAK